MTAFATDCIHAGRRADGDTGAILTPIHQVTTYAQTAIGEHKGYTYTRAANPTVAALEARLAALEGGADAVCFASGMAAIDAALRLVKAGEHLVVGEVVYGGTVRLIEQVLVDHGVRCTFVDARDPKQVANAIEDATRLVLVETPGNPTLDLVDLAAVADVCRAHGVLLAVDNTFPTPVLTRPFTFGADLVIHSTTKYLEGHNATVGGAVIVRNAGPVLERLRLIQKTAGAVLGPFDAWLTLRGIKTLPLRVAAHCAHAHAIALRLTADPRVARVVYPGLESHPQHGLVRAQQKGLGGGIVSFELAAAGGRTARGAADAFLGGLRLITLAENLGAAESLITHPASMTHGAVDPRERDRRGITDGLLRLSVGLEDVDDIWEDVARGLEAVASGGSA